MTVQRLSETFCSVVEEAIKANEAGDEIAWDAGLAGTPEGLIFAVLIQMPSPIIGGNVLQANLILGKGMRTTEAEIIEQVTSAMESLRQARSEMLAGGNGHPG